MLRLFFSFKLQYIYCILSIKFNRMSHKNKKWSNEIIVNFAQAKNLKCSLTDAISTYFRYTKIIPLPSNFHKICISEFILVIYLILN